MMFANPTVPLIPEGMMHDMYELVKSGGGYSEENGGQWIPGNTEQVKFRGVVLPVNDRDLMYAEAGTHTQCSRKAYTNGHALKVGSQVLDPQDGITYVVKQELGYNSVHPIKRYLIDSEGGVAKK